MNLRRMNPKKYLPATFVRLEEKIDLIQKPKKVSKQSGFPKMNNSTETALALRSMQI